MKYQIRVNTICKNCGLRNVMDVEIPEHIDVIACGNCGEFLSAPEIDGDEKNILRCVIDEELRRR